MQHIMMVSTQVHCLVGSNSQQSGQLFSSHSNHQIADFQYVGDISSMLAALVSTDNGIMWSGGISSTKAAKQSRPHRVSLMLYVQCAPHPQKIE